MEKTRATSKISYEDLENGNQEIMMNANTGNIWSTKKAELESCSQRLKEKEVRKTTTPKEKTLKNNTKEKMKEM